MEPVNQRIILTELPDQVIPEFNEGLKDLEKDMEELAAIQRDLSDYIGQQGEQVKSVEVRTAEIAKDVFQGTVSLKQAEMTQNKTRSMKLYVAAGTAAGLALGVATCVVLPPIGAVSSILSILVFTGSGAGVGSFLALNK